jgi:very-short-patch-repair endonuclease
MQRDDEVNEQLDALGWTVIRFWEEKIFSDLYGAILVIDAMATTPFEQRVNFDQDNFYDTRIE